MNDKNITKNLIIFVIILLVFTLMYIIIDKIMNKEKLDYGEFLKSYEVNEYIPSYVSDGDMAKIYLNDYIYNMYSDIDKAYNLLDEEYRIKKFGSIDNYANYVKTLTNSSYKVDSYYISLDGEYKIFGVYDTNGNEFIFKTNGVMQYTVYLDDYTVEI